MGVAPAPADDPLAAPRPVLDFQGCVHQLGFFPVDPQAAEAILPPGFTPTGVLGPAQVDLLVLSLRCDRLADAGPVAELHFGLVVDPPEELGNERAEMSIVLTHVASSSPVAVAAYEAWNVSASSGAGVELDASATPGAGTAQAGTTTLRTAVAGPASAGAAGSVRAFAVEDRAVRTVLDYRFPAYEIRSGAAVLQDLEGLSGFPAVQRDGLGYHEWGAGYGITVAESLPPAA